MGWVTVLRWSSLSSADLRWHERLMRNERRNERNDCGALNCRSVQRNGPGLFYSLIFMLAIINIWLIEAYSQWGRGHHRVGECGETLTYVHTCTISTGKPQTCRLQHHRSGQTGKKWTNQVVCASWRSFSCKVQHKITHKSLHASCWTYRYSKFYFNEHVRGF